MTRLSLAGSVSARKIYAFIAPRKWFYRRLFLLLLASALADIGLAALGLNPLGGPQQLVLFVLLGLYALGFAAAVPAAEAEEIALRLATRVERCQLLAAPMLVGLGVAGSLLAVWELRAFPNSGDEYAYLFEAQT